MRLYQELSIVVAITAVICAAATSAISAGPAKIVAGTLKCKGKGGVGLILGSKQQLSCSYDPAGKTPAQQYSATLSKIGVDIGFKGESIMIWTVLGSTGELPAGALAGKYGGVSAGAAIGIGASANALVGGNKDSIVLQPLSVEGQKGLNMAVGVSGLTLQHIP